jgi:hypothetical protein
MSNATGSAMTTTAYLATASANVVPADTSSATTERSENDDCTADPLAEAASRGRDRELGRIDHFGPSVKVRTIGDSSTRCDLLASVHQLHIDPLNRNRPARRSALLRVCTGRLVIHDERSGARKDTWWYEDEASRSDDVYPVRRCRRNGNRRRGVQHGPRHSTARRP